MKREERKHMIYSMTGYGRASAVRGGREITVELRSVNARYFEYTSRIPRSCAFLDSRLKALLNSRIARGKVEVSLTVQDLEAAGTEVAVDMDLARGYQQALRDMSEALGVKNDVTAGLLARFPDVLTTRQAEVDEEQLWADVSDVAAQAVQNFVEMRGIEGEKMLEDITGRLDTVESCVGRIEELTAGRVEKYTQRLYERLKVILEDRAIDDARGQRPAGGPQAGLFDPGAQPRGQHHRLQVPGPRHHPDRRGHEGGDRKDPRADPEPGVRA